ncbi:MAG: hypothetical protein ACOX4J_09705 [Anaerovoracaceae bacterium]
MKKMNTAFLEVVVSLLLIYALSACAATEGSIVILEDGHGTGFTMNFEDFDSINKCELSLTQGDVLQVEVEREEGGIAFSVSGKNGSEPYTGNDMMPGIFTVTVSETDDYVFSITGNNATGKIRVKNLGPKME